MALHLKGYPWRDVIVYALGVGSKFGEIKYGII
jgi:hypothetical protein